MRIGFIGLGIMGKPMALNLLQAGYELCVFDIQPEAVDLLKSSGAQAAVSPASVAKQCEVVLLMLPNSPQVREVLCGENGVLETLSPGSIVVDMSSIDPTVSVSLEQEVAQRGSDMLDCPVSGGEPKAIDGTLSFMCGGKPEVFEKVEKVLHCMGSSVVLVGKIGSGNVTKLANQIMVAVNIAGMSEALVLATKAGVDPKQVFEAIRGGLAGSTVLNAKAPMVLNRNFNPGFRIGLHIKDLTNAMDTANAHRMELPLTNQVLHMMEQLAEQGMAGLDHSALVRYYEQMNQVEVKNL